METYCPYCGNQLLSEACFSEHLADKHGLWSCLFCKKRFKDREHFERHMWRESCDEGGAGADVINEISHLNDSSAEAHWGYTEKMMHLVYVEAFKHGYKHGREDAKAKEPSKVSSY